MGRLVSIQYLRATAALMVVGYHVCLFGFRTGFEIGAAGVDVFFIISGFILWTVAAERPLPPLTFLWRRIGRVAPLYWIITLTCAAIAARWPQMIFDANPTWRHLALSLAFIHHTNPAGRPNPVLPVGWSLNNEALFYLLFSLVLFTKAEHRLRNLALALGLVVLIAIKIPHLYYIGYSGMFLQFLAGAWLAKLRLDGRLPEQRMGWLLILCAIAGFALLQPFDLYETLVRPLAWGAPALALVAGGVTLETRKPLPDVPVLRFLGDASYSIYLIHWPVISMLQQVMQSRQLIFLPLAFTASIAAGIALHLGLERPLLRLFHERLGGAALPSRAT